MTSQDQAPGPEQRRVEHLRTVARLYEETWKDYRGAWMDTDNRALHFGYWDAATRGHAHSLLRMNEVMADRAGIWEGAEVLDAGCGVGGAAMWLAARRGARVHGITISQDQVARALRYAGERGLRDRVAFSAQDFARTSLPDRTFDVVWTQESVCHALDRAEFLAEAYRLLRPGGRLVQEEPFRTAGALDPPDERLLAVVLDGWAIPGLPSLPDYLEQVRRAGFVGVEAADISQQVGPSLRRLHRWAVACYPALALLRRVGARSAVQHANVRSALGQWAAFRRRLWLVALVSAEKPAAAPTDRA